MNRLARLAALARVAGNNLPSALATESQVRLLVIGCCRGCQGLTLIRRFRLGGNNSVGWVLYPIGLRVGNLLGWTMTLSFLPRTMQRI